jgi:tetratricopeptide (TPR) repeat protein
MSWNVKLVVVLAAAIGLQQGVAANGSAVPDSSAGASISEPSRTPEQMARESYNSGIEHRDKAKKAEEQAAAQTKDSAKNLQKAKDEFTKALKDFQRATDLDPTLYQAYNGMGYAYRKTGDYTKALVNYDVALKLAPTFPDAIEYRGEAYLGLNRLDDAKAAYMTLFASDRTQADALLKAMNEWVAKQATVAGADPATVSAFADWVKERAKIASTTVAMARTGTRSIWR